MIDDKYLPLGCFSLLRAQDDPFTSHQKSEADTFVGRDKELHRNSWLWPKMARRFTKNNPAHVSNWRKPVEVDDSQCAMIHEALRAKLGDSLAINKLPKACQAS